MRFFLQALFLSLASVTAFANGGPSPTEWKQIEAPGVDRAWRNRSDGRRLLTYFRHKPKKKTDLAVSDQNLAVGIFTQRQVTLEQFGFSQIRFRSFGHEKKKATDFVSMSGSYQRPDGITVQFFEVQKFEGGMFSQFSLFDERPMAPADGPILENMLRQWAFSNDRRPAAESVEADAGCLECVEPSPNAIDEAAKKAADIKATIVGREKTPECKDRKPFLIDPDKKSILEDFGFKVTEDTPTTVIAGRSALTCFYGAAAGAYGSIRDLVMLVPEILGLLWKGGVAAKDAIGKIDFNELRKDLAPQSLWSKAKSAISYTSESVTSAAKSASEYVYSAYQEGGVGGSVAAVAQAALAASPHRVVGKFIAELGVKVADALVEEWKGFACLPPEVMTQVVCQVVGYIATDIATGKLLISALKESIHVKEAIRLVKIAMSGKERESLAAKAALHLEPDPAIAKALSHEPEMLESYKEFTRKTDLLKKDGKLDAETEQGLREVQQSFATAKEKPNLQLLNEATDLAVAEGSGKSLKTVNEALQSFRKIDEALPAPERLQKWEAQIMSEKPHLSEEEVRRAGQCLQSSGVR